MISMWQIFCSNFFTYSMRTIWKPLYFFVMQLDKSLITFFLSRSCLIRLQNLSFSSNTLKKRLFLFKMWLIWRHRFSKCMMSRSSLISSFSKKFWIFHPIWCHVLHRHCSHKNPTFQLKCAWLHTKLLRKKNQHCHFLEDLLMFF